MGNDSGSGVLFTRNPSTGEDVLTGEFLTNAQGEDVVAGLRTPSPLSLLRHAMPAAYDDLHKSVKRLEVELGDMQDVEFTVQRGTLYILQTRNGKRTGAAALKIALDMVRAGTVDVPTALTRLIIPAQVDQLLHKRFSDEGGAAYKGAVVGRGIPASPGAAVGTVVFDAADAVRARAEGRPVILVRPETSAEDVAGMHGADGILTTHGGMTSHAAVVARGWGKTAVCGAGFLHLDLSRPGGGAMMVPFSPAAAQASGHVCTDDRLCRGGAHAVALHRGDWVSVNGTTGEVLLGKHERCDPSVGPDLLTLLDWARAHAAVAVRSNSDSGDDVAVAATFKAAGVGLCRTEHMFWGPQRITHMRAVILAPSPEAQHDALEALYPFQKSDFLDLFLGVGRAGGAVPPTVAGCAPVTDGAGRPTSAGLKQVRAHPPPSPGAALGRGRSGAYPVTVRLLDPSLHEYLPNVDTESGREEAGKVAATLGMPPGALVAVIRGMKEANPMLGHRGCRVEITHPAIPRLQTRAVISAAAEALSLGVPVEVQIMIPLVTSEREMAFLRDLVETEAVKTQAEACARLGIPPFPFKIGTMLETPRAALVAASIAQSADFFSFGTNDLTALTFGFSRDDAPKFIPAYLEKGLLLDDPFQSLDVQGVGELIRMAVERGRRGNPSLEVGVCGEVGGDVRSVDFFVNAGVDYVSVSPFRVPAAWLASAQVGLRRAGGGGGKTDATA